MTRPRFRSGEGPFYRYPDYTPAALEDANDVRPAAHSYGAPSRGPTTGLGHLVRGPVEHDPHSRLRLDEWPWTYSTGAQYTPARSQSGAVIPGSSGHSRRP